MNHPPQFLRSGPVRLVLAGIVLATCALASPAFAVPGERSPDRVWTEVSDDAVARGMLVESFENPTAYRLLQIDDFALFGVLRNAPQEAALQGRPSSTILTLPHPDGGYARFRVAESPILSDKLRATYPDFKTYVVQGVDDPTHSGRILRTPFGFNAMIVTPDDFLVVERATDASGPYYLSFRKSMLPQFDGISCSVEPSEGLKLENSLLAPPSGANLRTYDLALVATGEYRAFYGSDAAVTARMTAMINAVNALYEREVAIRFQITCTSIYANAGTDPFTDPESVDGTLLDEADAALDADCAGGYEVGHLVHHRAGGGNSFSGRAAISSACQGNAGRAASTGTAPNSALWTVDLLPHEIGHQFSAQHTYNSTAGGCVERQGGDAYEIGSGTTIMSYACAGCTGEDANGNGCADAYFHTHSFDQITNYREAGGNCGAQTATGNSAPGVNAGPNYTIPRGTPFTLTATGSDPDGDALTWCWEQHDLGAASPPLGGNGPLFRSFLPVAGTSRTFPNLTDLLANNPTPFEILPTTDRTMTFRATARDNRAGGGGVNYGTTTITVDGDPFVLNYPNGGQLLNTGCEIEVQWTVGGGDVAPNVNILFSTDGGLTFPTTLASNVPNDGAHTVRLPCTTTSDGRIRIEGAGNIFFDVSNNDFIVMQSAPTASAVTAPTEVFVNAGCSVTFNVSGSISDDCAISTGDVTITATALGGTATVTPNIVEVQNGDDEVTYSGTVTVSALTGCPAIIRITATGADGCGLSDSEIADVTVIDNTDPVVLTDATGGKVGPTCAYELPFSATITDNCLLDPNDVLVVVTNPSNNATVGTPTWVTQQVSDTELSVTGSVIISDLTSCPADITVDISIADGCDNDSNDAITVEVVDNTPPEIAVELNRTYLWPPNHKLVDIVAEVTVTDNCPNPSFVLTSITSNEPDDDLGDGSTSPDIVGAEIGTADTEFQLRSERMGPRTGRVYTCTYTASDNCGNTDVAVVEVRVEHDQAGNAFVVVLGSGTASGVGTEGAAGLDYLAVVVPSKVTPALEGDPDLSGGSLVDRSAGARRFEPMSHLLVGNTYGTVEPTQVGRADVDGDGLVDAIALFALGKAEAIRSGSDELDGPVGLHYANEYGESFLVPDLLAVPRDELGSTLGEAVRTAIASMPDVEIVPEAVALAPAKASPAPAAAETIASAGMPATTRLAGMRPNPFFRQTAIDFELARPATVRLEVYSPSGARVRGLAVQAFEPGRHAVPWDGRDDSGRRVSPGVYFVRFVADGVTNTSKALLLP